MKFGETIYLDNNATTPVDPRVTEAMQPWFFDQPGNASSRSHVLGWVAEEAVDTARMQVAAAIGAGPADIVFTSGATEAINLAIKGVAGRYVTKGRHLVAISTEHRAVLDTLGYLEKQGFEISLLPVDEKGHIDLDQLERTIRPDTVLVSAMYANNETGVIHPVQQVGAICREKNVLFFCDATQAAGKLPIDVQDTGIHLLALSGHKVYGPKGTGALYVRQSAPRVHLTPLIHGGGHEGGLRSGTMNGPGIVGLGKALTIAADERTEETSRLRKLRDHFERSLQKDLEGVTVNGDSEQRLSHVSNLNFLHVRGDTLMTKVGPGIACSSGSACASATAEPSHVLLEMGLTEREANSSVRFSLGRFTDRRDMDEAIRMLVGAVRELRSISPVWEMYKTGMLGP